MFYIVIDTNILKQFVNIFNDDNLALLHLWSSQKQIQFLSAPDLLAEWNEKHREESLRGGNEKLKKARKEVKEKQAFGYASYEPDIEPGLKRIASQVDMIDDLLASSPPHRI